jgi:Uma2 family endonuclease
MLTTVERYRELPELPGVIQELRLGKVITLPLPKVGTFKLQCRIEDLLRQIVGAHGIVAHRFAFRALPQYDLRGADVAFVSKGRWNETDDNDNLRGSPELVIEILSPSNTKTEARKKAALCLSTGCEEFWVVDPQRKTVNVTQQDGDYTLYGIGDRIPLTRFNAGLDVDAIFVI